MARFIIWTLLTLLTSKVTHSLIIGCPVDLLNKEYGLSEIGTAIGTYTITNCPDGTQAEIEIEGPWGQKNKVCVRTKAVKKGRIVRVEHLCSAGVYIYGSPKLESEECVTAVCQSSTIKDINESANNIYRDCC